MARGILKTTESSDNIEAFDYNTTSTLINEYRSTSATPVTDRLFTGQILDATGLYYYNARYYDPEIGRFISPDSIVQSPANPQTLNRYSYCINNPLIYTDQSGHFWMQFLVWVARAIFVSATSSTATNVSINLLTGHGAFDSWSWSGFGADIGIDLVTGGLGKYTKIGRLFGKLGSKVDNALGFADEVSEVKRLKFKDVDISLPDDIKRLSAQNITSSRVTVLGHVDTGYIQKALKRKASYFDIGSKWGQLSETQRIAANKHFLDLIADKGDQILLSVPKGKIRPSSYLMDEIEYLTKEKGYRWINQWSLVK